MEVRNWYARFYRGIIAEGEGIVTEADVPFAAQDFADDGEGVSFFIAPGVTELAPGVLDVFVTLKELRLAPSVKKVGVTEEAAEMLKRNGVIVRGAFDSYAERFAREQHLVFLHEDIRIVGWGDYFEHGSWTLDLQFAPDGSAGIYEDCQTQGISAGSMGGASNTVHLPRDFYQSLSPKEIEAMLWSSFSGDVERCEAYHVFVKKARERGGYYIQY